MKIFNLEQGSPEWHKFRSEHYGASDAPAMMGVSKYMTRNDLLKQKKTGIAPEVSPATQALFDRGHAAEAGGRKIVEEMLDDEFYPVVGVLEGTKISASLDGINLLGDLIMEHKLWSETLADAVSKQDLPEQYKVQMDQQLLVSGASKAIFVISDGTETNFAYMYYETTEERKQAIIDGWAQFEKDLAEFEVQPEPEIIEAAKIEQLPALRISVTGMVNSSNLGEYKQIALARIESVNTTLVTDQDFADAEEAVKFFKKAEGELASGKKAILAQTASIDDVFRTIDDISETMRQKRLMLEKLVKQQKESIKMGIVAEAKEALFAHWETETRGLPESRVCPVNADFAGSIKGKKTLSSMKDAVDAELAAAKIEVTKMAARLKVNYATFETAADGFAFLFNDLSKLVNESEDAFAAIVKSRIADYKREQQAKLEAERERIRAEEQRKAEAEAAKIRAEEQRKAEESVRKAEAEALQVAHDEQQQLLASRTAEAEFLDALKPVTLDQELSEWAHMAGVSKKDFAALLEILNKHQIKVAA